MQETLIWSLGQEDLLEKGMATHSRILASGFPWTEEPGGFSPWGRKESDMTKHGYTFTFNPLKVHPCCCKWQDFLLFYSWIIQFSSVTQSCLTLCNPMKYLIPSYFYSFIYQWILSLLPCIGKVNNVEVKVGLPMSFLVSVLVFFG